MSKRKGELVTTNSAAHLLATNVSSSTKRNTVPSRGGLTGWSSRHQQASLVGSLRAAHSGAAYRER